MKKFQLGIRRIFNLKSMKFKLSFILIVMIIVPMLLQGTLIYRKSFSTLVSQRNDDSKVLSKQVDSSLDEFLLGIQYELDSLSKQDGLIAIANRAEDADFLNSARNKDNAYEVEDPLVNQKISLTRASLLDILQDPNIKTCYFATRSKNMAAGKAQYVYGKTDKDSFDPTTREWYSKAVANKGKIVWSDPYLDREKGMMVVTVSKTIESAGTTYGVLAMDINLNSLMDKLKNLKMGTEGKLFILSDKGKFILHPDKSFVDKNVEDDKLAQILKKNSDASEYIDGKDHMIIVKNHLTGWNVMLSFSEKEFASKTSLIRNFVILATLLGSIFAIFIAIQISNWIVKKLNELNVAFAQASGGDFTTTIDVKSKDEFGQIGEAFNSMIRDINSSFKEIADAVNIMFENSKKLESIGSQTKMSSQEVGAVIMKIAEDSSVQSYEAENGEKKMNEFSDSMDLVSSSISNMESIVLKTENSSKKGMKTVDSLTHETDKMLETGNELRDVVLDVDNSLKEIGEIIYTIEEIAAQTNLLALNASIEAARVGELGRGFSVVAEEIRKLAEESEDATSRIYGIITNIKNKSNNAVSSINKNGAMLNEYGHIVCSAREVFTTISSDVSVMLEEASNVKDLSSGMMTGKEDIQAFIQNIHSSIESTSSSTQEISASTEETIAMMENLDQNVISLYELAETLRKKINNFKI